MTDTSVTITIPESNIDRVLKGITGMYPIPQVKNDGVLEDEFTDKVWAKKCIINFIKNTVRRYEENKAKNEISIDPTDDIVL